MGSPGAPLAGQGARGQPPSPEHWGAFSYGSAPLTWGLVPRVAGPHRGQGLPRSEAVGSTVTSPPHSTTSGPLPCKLRRSRLVAGGPGGPAFRADPCLGVSGRRQSGFSPCSALGQPIPCAPLLPRPSTWPGPPLSLPQEPSPHWLFSLRRDQERPRAQAPVLTPPCPKPVESWGPALPPPGLDPPASCRNRLRPDAADSNKMLNSKPDTKSLAQRKHHEARVPAHPRMPAVLTRGLAPGWSGRDVTPPGGGGGSSC